MRDAWDITEDRILSRVRELEGNFIRIHKTLSLLRDDAKIERQRVRNLIIRHLEGQEDMIIDELGELIGSLTAQPPEGEAVGRAACLRLLDKGDKP